MTPRKLVQLIVITTLTLGLTPINGTYASQDGRSIQTQVNKNHLVEEFSFFIKDFKVDHQGQNNLNISVKYQYKRNMTLSDYPDFRLIAKDIETFLTHYPNETDYWEIVNKKITALILEKYSSLETV